MKNRMIQQKKFRRGLTKSAAAHTLRQCVFCIRSQSYERDQNLVAGIYICRMLSGCGLHLRSGAVAVFRQLRELGLCGLRGGSCAVHRHRHPVRAADPDDPVRRHGPSAGALGHQVAAGRLRRHRRGVPVFRGGVHVRRRRRHADPAVPCAHLAGQHRVHGGGISGDAAGRDGHGQRLLGADPRAHRCHRGLCRGSLHHLRYGGHPPAGEREHQSADAQLGHRGADLRLL